MSGDTVASLIYLSLLVCVIAGYFLVSNRNRLGQLSQYAVLWGLIFIGIVAGFGLWDDVRSTSPLAQRLEVSDQGAISVPRSPDGHYYMTVSLNDAPVRFVVDTGATAVVLTKEDAARAGLNIDDLRFLGRANTANGTVRTAPARIEEFTLGDRIDRNVPVQVNEGEMQGSLLGMSYLDRFSAINIQGNRMTLVP